MILEEKYRIENMTYNLPHVFTSMNNAIGLYKKVLTTSRAIDWGHLLHCLSTWREIMSYER